MLTSHYPNEEIKLLHGVAERGDDETQPSQTSTNYDDRSTAKSVDKDAADWTWRQRGDQLINGLHEITIKLNNYLSTTLLCK